METRKCAVCGVEITRSFKSLFRSPPEKTFCNKCKAKAVAKYRNRDYSDMTRERNHNWKGGLCRSWGYVYVLQRDHPNANKHGYVKRANLIVEQRIGRLLKKGEMVHHINEIKDDDSPENLELTTRGEHQRNHVIKFAAMGIYKGTHSKHRKGKLSKEV